jgi:hypothetical protein
MINKECEDCKKTYQGEPWRRVCTPCSELYEVCEECGGDGYTTCCGVGVTEPGWPDSDFCAGCYEHSGSACETCNGKGEIKNE